MTHLPTWSPPPTRQLSPCRPACTWHTRLPPHGRKETREFPLICPSQAEFTTFRVLTLEVLCVCCAWCVCGRGRHGRVVRQQNTKKTEREKNRSWKHCDNSVGKHKNGKKHWSADSSFFLARYSQLWTKNTSENCFFTLPLGFTDVFGRRVLIQRSQSCFGKGPEQRNTRYVSSWCSPIRLQVLQQRAVRMQSRLRRSTEGLSVCSGFI